MFFSGWYLFLCKWNAKQNLLSYSVSYYIIMWLKFVELICKLDSNVLMGQYLTLEYVYVIATVDELFGDADDISSDEEEKKDDRSRDIDEEEEAQARVDKIVLIMWAKDLTKTVIVHFGLGF